MVPNLFPAGGQRRAGSMISLLWPPPRGVRDEGWSEAGVSAQEQTLS